MHIQNRSAVVVFELLIGALAALATWIQFLSFGASAWRLFATWLALVAAIYYSLNAIITLFAKRRTVGADFCPMLQGGLIIAGITLVLIHVVSYATDSYVPSAGGNAFLTGFILPVMMIMAWVMFSTKGAWRAYDPLYWLALVALYLSAILVSGEFMPRTARFAYPYEFLNYPSIGIDIMLWWFAIFAVVILAAGYILWVLDFGLSGKLAKHIVLPKIKVVIIEEEVEDEAPAPARTSTPAPTRTPDPAPAPAAKAKSAESAKPAASPMPKTPTPKPTTPAKPVAQPTPKPAEKPAVELPPKPEKKPEEKPEEKPVKLITTGARNQQSSPDEIIPPSLPTVRIIEKVDVAPPATGESTRNLSQEVVIKDGQKSVAPKIELPMPPTPPAPTQLPLPPKA